MSRKIKGILIDPDTQTLKEVEFDSDLQSYYDLMDCTIVDRIAYDDNHDVVVDDEGLLKDPKNFFMISGYEGLLAGKAIIVGVGVDPDDKDGGLCWVSHNLDHVRVGFVRARKSDEEDGNNDTGSESED